MIVTTAGSAGHETVSGPRPASAPTEDLLRTRLATLITAAETAKAETLTVSTSDLRLILGQLDSAERDILHALDDVKSAKHQRDDALLMAPRVLYSMKPGKDEP